MKLKTYSARECFSWSERADNPDICPLIIPGLAVSIIGRPSPLKKLTSFTGS